MNDMRAANQVAYRRLRETIKQGFPFGRFVAILGGRIVADAASFEELRAAIREQGQDPGRALIVQAGEEYPETVTIFA